MSSIDKATHFDSAIDARNNNKRGIIASTSWFLNNDVHEWSLKMISSSLWQYTVAPIITFVNIPPISMIITCHVYGGILYYSIQMKNPILRYALLAYLPYCIFDHSSSFGWKNFPLKLRKMIRSNFVYRWVAQYFPVSLHKTAELNPEYGPYLFCYHPHGVISMGCNLGFNTNGAEFDTLFPGLENRNGVTISQSFFAPLYREWMLALGMINANKASIECHLVAGNSIVLVPGGAAEALHAHANVSRLILQRRRGFLQIAQNLSIPVVPCYAFGENNIFQTWYHYAPQEDTLVCDDITVSAQPNALATPTIMKKQHGFSNPLGWPLPLPHPINIVVGAPIFLPREWTVDRCHAEYCKQLHALYNIYSPQFGYGNVSLEIL
jgi:hypothetical protein